jgi:hypothetical protein
MPSSPGHLIAVGPASSRDAARGTSGVLDVTAEARVRFRDVDETAIESVEVHESEELQAFRAN